MADSADCHRVDTARDSVNVGLDALAGAEVRGADASALAEQLLWLDRVSARVAGEFARRLEVFDRSGGAAADGAVSTGAWLRQFCRLSPGDSRRRVTLARALADHLTETADALAAGEVSAAHARVIVDAVSELPEQRMSEAESILLPAAKALDPRQLAVAARRLRLAIDPDGALTGANAVHERRHLTVAGTFQGAVAVQGLLDPEAGATVLAALMPLTTPTGPEDDRTAGQRRADALVELARRVLDGGTLPDCGGERPHISITVDASALADSAAGADMEWGGPVGQEVLGRYLCDPAIARVVTAGRSEVLDVGRLTRIIPTGLRRALVTRDRGCAWPGCDRPPPWCDGHHLQPWQQGGETSLRNLALLCRRHHRFVHEAKWRLTRDDAGGWHTTAPTPRRPGSPRPDG